MSDKTFENYPQQLAQMALEAAKKEHDAIEAMCERMLVTPGSPGISVQRVWKHEADTYSCITETRLNPEVPFGEIHYLPDVGGLSV